MTGRERLLAEIEARRLEAERRRRAGEPIEVLSADLRFAGEDAGHDPYDNPGPAKPLDVGRPAKAARKRKRR